MTVAELIQQLTKMPHDAKVLLVADDGETLVNVANTQLFGMGVKEDEFVTIERAAE